MKNYKQFAEQEGVRRVDFVDGITGEGETMNEILPAVGMALGRAASVVGKAAVGAAKVGAKVAKPVAKTAGKLATKGAKKVVKKAGKAAADQISDYRERQQQKKTQAKKDRDAMGRHESVVKEDWVDDEARKVERRWKSMTKQAKVRWVDMMHDKAGKRNLYDFELEDWLDDYGIDISKAATKKWESASVEEMAYEMNRYVNTLSIDRTRNLWTEAAQQGEDPEPVKGKKSMTGEKQETVKINPKEALPLRGPKVGALT